MKLSNSQNYLLWSLANKRQPKRYNRRTMRKLTELGFVKFEKIMIAGFDGGEYRVTDMGLLYLGEKM